MPDYIGRIEIPEPVAATGAFPLRTDYPHGAAMSRAFVTHVFADGVEQRFYVGSPATRYTFRRSTLSRVQRAALAAFWRSTLGCVESFFYDVPQEDGSFLATEVRFENAPLRLEDLANAITSVGITFSGVVDPSTAPVYSGCTTVTRFPDATLGTALQDDIQELIPLIKIRVTEVAVDDIYLADRRVTVDGNLHLPRLLGVGEEGAEVLIEQSIDGSADDVQFTFGNADRVMIALANDTDLMNARVELSLYHVASQRKLDLWAGMVTDWSTNTGPDFIVRASDRLAALTLSSPVGTCTRSCRRRYAQDGCPATSGTQAMDTTHFPDSDAATCDLGYETANGCLAHSGGANPTKRYFGGVWAKPQQVRILNNGTGVKGFWRDTITPTSQISDSLWGQTLPEIWHHDDGVPQRGMPVTCRIAAGREESDFYIALGVVGKGPLGAYSVATMVDTDGDAKKETFVGSTLDGQPHHGWKTDDDGNPTGTSYGLRQFIGEDPAEASAYFAIARVGTSPTSWREVTGGGSCVEETFAAGVAFMEIRRVDEKGVQVSTVASHSMIAMVSQGLTALTWSAPGTRGTSAGCTNPIWVAVNTFLRAIGLESADAATQEAEFDVVAAIAAAATADTLVTPIFGGGTEKQFRFKGTIDASKPTRDWLRDILNNGLGYFTWSFGRLKLGCRNTATPTTTFREGSILMASLRMDPVKPGFEKLTVEFADEEYLFARNTVSYTDQDYAARNGRVANPRESQLGLVGTASKSQASRLAVCRAREELGGVGDTEQKAARNLAWKSTILALDVEAGAVVTLVDDEIPDGSGTFRVQAWRLNRDWSVDLVGKTVRASMYDLTAGTVPAAVTEAVQPIAAARDSGAPPTPSFSARVSLVDPTALEIYDLAFAQTTNTRTIRSATFTISFSGGVADRVETVNFPSDFFAGAGASGWALKVSLPGKTVTSIDGYVTNNYGNSDVHTETVDLAMAMAALQSGAGATGDAVIFDSTGALVSAGAPPILFRSVGFLLAWKGGDAVGDDIAGHRPIVGGVAPYKLVLLCEVGPVGADYAVDIKRWHEGTGASILASPLAVAAGDTTSSTTTFAEVALSDGDYFTIHATQAEGNTPPVNVFVELLLQEN